MTWSPLRKPLAALLAFASIVALVSLTDDDVQAAESFADQTIISNVGQLTALDFLPDGRTIAADRTGRVYVGDITGSSPSLSNYLTIPDVEITGEAGMLNITTDGWDVYVYYTHRTSKRVRVATFRFTGNATTDLANRRLVYETPNQFQLEKPIHFGGFLDVGNDGKLYLAVGDQANNVATLDSRNNVWGKLLRINKDGTIPSDNPYVGSTSGLDEVWAHGLRNPYRGSVDAPTGRIYIGDVGGNIDSPGDDPQEEVNIARKGADYGWWGCEGTISSTPGGCSGVTLPTLSYGHRGTDAAVTGGEIYRETLLPAPYRGAYIFGDYGFDELYYASVNADGSLNSPVRFAAATDPVWVGAGPDGNIYYLEFGFDGSHVHRMTFSGTNQPPRITSTSVTPATGLAPHQVSASAQATDPEGQALTYTWEWGDGTTTTGRTATHTYSTSGPYNVRVRVSDGTSTVTSAARKIQVGTVPTASINSMSTGRNVQVGTRVSFTGSGYDPSQQITGADMEWVAVLLHENHFHPIAGPSNGTSFSFTARNFEDHPYPLEFEVRLTVTDRVGLTHTVTRRVTASQTAPSAAVNVTTNYPSSDAPSFDLARDWVGYDRPTFQLAGVHALRFVMVISGNTQPETLPASDLPTLQGSLSVTTRYAGNDLVALEWMQNRYNGISKAMAQRLGTGFLSFVSNYDRAIQGG